MKDRPGPGQPKKQTIGVELGWEAFRMCDDLPHAKRYISVNAVGDVLRWDVAARKLEHSLPLDGNRSDWQMSASARV